MRDQRLYYTILFMCRMLNVSPSGYYAWLNRKPSKHTIEEMRLEAEIKSAHKRNREVAGPETLQRDLKEHGIKETTVAKQAWATSEGWAAALWLHSQ